MTAEPMKTRTRKSARGSLPVSAAVAAGSILFLAGPANAQLFWDSNGTANGFGNTTGTWGTSNFWNTSSTGGSGTFSSTTSSSDTVNFGTASANYGNAAVGIVAGGVTVNSIVYGAGQTTAINIGTSGNNLTLAGTTPTITVNNTRFHQVISSPIAGTAGLTKTGAGTLVLRGTNAYTGGTTVNGGTLSFGTVASKSTGTHTFNAGTTLGLGFDGTGLFTATDILNAFAGTFTGNLSGITLADPSVNIAIDTTSGAKTFSANIGSSTRGLVKIANGFNLTLTGANEYSGRTVVAGGSALIVNSLGNIADTSSNIGTNSTVDMLDVSRIDIATSSSSDKNFNLLGTATIFPGDAITFTHTGSITTSTAGAKTLQLATNGTSLTDIKDFQGVISDGSGTIAFSKISPGNIWLSGNNTYTGASSVSGGILIIGHANALGSTVAGTTVSNGATLGLRNNITTAAEALTINPGTSGNALIRNFSGNNTWSGSITSTTGTSSNVSRIASDAGTMTLAGTVNITGSAHQFILQGDGNITISGQITGVGIVTSATAGTGTRRLSNDTSNYTGPTRANGGVLEFTSIANVGSASSLGAPTTVGDGTINLGFDTTNATLRYVGTATGGHTSDRIVRLNSGAAPTSTFAIEANGTGPLVLTSGVTAANGSKTLTLGGTSTAVNAIGVIANGGSGTISLTKEGGGTWLLTGTNTYVGATNVNNGKLLVDGSIAASLLTTVSSGATIGGNGTTGALAIQSGGFITPGNSSGILNTGNYTQAGLYTAEINGLTAGSQHDQINVSGSVDITGGSLSTTFSGSYALNDLVFILGNDGTDAITGIFTGLSQGAIAASYGGFDWEISYLADTAGGTFLGGNDIALRAIPEPGAALLAGLSLMALLRRRRP